MKTQLEKALKESWKRIYFRGEKQTSESVNTFLHHQVISGKNSKMQYYLTGD